MRINLFSDVYFFLSETKMVQFFKKSAKKVLSPYVVSRTLISLKENTPRNFFFTRPTSDKRKILVFFCPDYGNLGDVGIYIAQKRFLEENLPDAEIIDIPVNKTLDGISWFRNRMNTNDLIVMSGGGFFGDLYPLMEHYRQMIVKYFPSISIVSFPQSTFFSDTTKGLKLLNRSSKIYNNHRDLTLIGRDLSSYRFMQDNFPGCFNVCLPDIVLSMSKWEDQIREGIVFCWRKDFESGVKDDDKSKIESTLMPGFKNVKFSDTNIQIEDLSMQNLIRNFQSLIQTFRNAELVVTDRLHGMLFCYLTNTPCIVVNDKNSKVENCYQSWLTKASYLKLYSKGDELNDLNRFSHDVLTGGKNDKNVLDFKPYFEQLKNIFLSKASF